MPHFVTECSVVRHRRRRLLHAQPSSDQLSWLALRHSFETETVGAAERATGTLPGGRPNNSRIRRRRRIHQIGRGTAARGAGRGGGTACQPDPRCGGRPGAFRKDNRRRGDVGEPGRRKAVNRRTRPGWRLRALLTSHGRGPVWPRDWQSPGQEIGTAARSTWRAASRCRTSGRSSGREVRSFRDWRCSGHHMVVRRGTPFARHPRRGPGVSGESRHDEIGTRHCAVGRSTPKQVCQQVCDGVIEPMCEASQSSIVSA
jgi:hypothetical protein